MAWKGCRQLSVGDSTHRKPGRLFQSFHVGNGQGYLRLLQAKLNRANQVDGFSSL
jgi:hypothetical protein